jgi:light-regulated signal transduction histidine kinase (bacteriophytochrome)
VTPNIKVSAKRQDGWTFIIKDNGIGIAKEYQDSVFRMFKRLHTKSEYEGTGIGLAHCKKIVELHNGNIWVESTPGEGSVFYCNFPDEIYA